MKKIFLIGLVLVLILIAGCAPKVYTLEETLLRELENCDYKFGIDSSEKRQLNVDYCQRLLEEIRQYEEQGLIQINEEVLTEKEIKINPQIEQEQNDKINDATKEIIGDI